MRAIDWVKGRIVEGFRRLPPTATHRVPGATLRARTLGFHSEVLRVYPVAYDSAPTRAGFTMAGTTADLLQRNVYLHGVWEPHITRWVGTHLRGGDVVVDVGANVGYFSLLSASCVGPTGTVIAFEPVPSIVDRLRRNLELNGLQEIVDVRPVIATDAPGSAEIFRGSDENLGLSATTAGDGRSSEGTVDCVRGADVIHPALWDRVRLVKVDTEGDDLRALRGLRPLLDAMPAGAAAVVEVTPEDLRERGQTPQDLVDEMRDAGFGRMLAVPNSYAGAEYASGVIRDPIEIRTAPSEKTDVVFLKPPAAAPAP